MGDNGQRRARLSPAHPRPPRRASSVAERALLIVVVALACAACRAGDTPATIAYGAQKCSRCDQTIAQRRFAAQYRGGDGATRVFDDPGCLFLALKDDPGAGAIFFQDYGAERWIAADDLYLVRVPGTDTPRHHGWIALASFSAAQDIVTSAGSGEVLRFAEAREKLP